jgi:hypothetical protein
MIKIAFSDNDRNNKITIQHLFDIAFFSLALGFSDA